jgi:hypothetical protein
MPHIEEMFGDFKKHGFDLEKTKLCHFQRLSRLTLAVAILYGWLVSVGTQTIHARDWHLVDRKERRDLCIFRIGLRYIERCLTSALPIKNSAMFLPLIQNCRITRCRVSKTILQEALCPGNGFP